jgi:hypothetical protein
MNALLDPIRQAARDLVQKKLWPIAVVLLVALVAVPIVIGGSSEDTPAPVPTAAATAAPDTAASLVTVVDQPVTGDDDRSGKIEDPIYNPPKPPPVEATTGSTPSAPSTPSTDATTGGNAAPGDTTPAQPAEPVAKPTYYRTEVRWYENTFAKPRPITRLTPLGGLVDTAALYMGVGSGSKGLHAIFLLGPTATADGEGECVDENCRAIGLKSGQTRLVTVQPADGSEARQYILEVVSVRAITTDAADARTMRAKVHPDGRDVMRSMWEDGPTATALKPFQYDYARGVLVITADAPGASAPEKTSK